MTMTQTWQSRFTELHQSASAQSDLNDFGDTDYHEGLRVLLRSLDEEAVSGGKAAMMERLLLGTLVSRLKTEDQWKAHPQYRTKDVPAPLVVIGVPRTGTTALHNLLSQDEQFQGIERWICDAPLVRPAREQWQLHPQYQASAALYDQFLAVAPKAMVAHGVKPSDVDECLLPMSQSFCSNTFPSQVDLPGYDAWLMQADETRSYERYKDVLRLVGLNDDRRWLLKNPSHVFGIDALLAVFPDACIVQTHRHPAASLASLVSLLDSFMAGLTGEPLDRDRRLAREAAFWAEGVRRTMAAQDRHPDRFVNVIQGDIRSDPMGVVAAIYSKFGLELSPGASAAMQGWASANETREGEGHAYEKIARDAPLVAPFAEYVERYGL